MSDPIADPLGVEDCFVTALSQFDHIEGCTRLWFTVPESLGGTTCSIVRAKLIVPVSALIPLGRAICAAAPQETVVMYPGRFAGAAH